MTSPEHKITVRDLTDKALNAREEILRNGKIRKPFIFKGYTTESDRIKDTIKNNKYLYNIFESEPIKTEIINKKEEEDVFDFNIQNPSKIMRRASFVMPPDKLKYILKNDIIVQPQMRFKPRTDLERVYDALNGRYFRNDEKAVLDRQLKNIGLYSFDRRKDLVKKVSLLNGSEKILLESSDEEEENETKRTYQIKPNPIIPEEKKEEKVKKNIYGDGNLYYIPQNYEYKPWMRHHNLNSEAESMLKEFHVKTHFKAAEEIAENKIVTKKDEKIRNKKRKKKIESQRLKLKDPFYFEKTHFKEEEKVKKYTPYLKNMNPYKGRNKPSYDLSTLTALSNLAFTTSNELPISLSENKNTFGKKKDKDSESDLHEKKKLVDENNVLINGEIYYKDSQFDIIAEKVLKSCKFHSIKSKHNNSRLRKGEGKTMITRGMSVKQFEKKYNLEEI